MKKQWCIPKKENANFVYHMEDVLEVYKRPYNPKLPVICMDEVCKQLIKETRLPFSVKKGRLAKYDYEYERNGMANIFMCVEPLTGRKQTKVTNRRTKIDWAQTIQELIDIHCPKAEKIILVLDNLNTHNGGSLYETFKPEEAQRLLRKLEFHHTPKHGSWLNIAETAISILSQQCLARRIPNFETLSDEVEAWTTNNNRQEKKINWQFTTENARIKLKKLYPKILN